jgi:hypothetical protein
MGKSLRAEELNRSLLFPASLHDWLADNHLARFLAAVVNALGWSKGSFLQAYNSQGRWIPQPR